jgi:hypothetical protein
MLRCGKARRDPLRVWSLSVAEEFVGAGYARPACRITSRARDLDDPGLAASHSALSGEWRAVLTELRQGANSRGRLASNTSRCSTQAAARRFGISASVGRPTLGVSGWLSPGGGPNEGQSWLRPPAGGQPAGDSANTDWR